MQRIWYRWRGGNARAHARRALLLGWVGALLAAPMATAQTPAETAAPTMTGSPVASPIATPAPTETGAVNAAAELGEVIWAREIDPATNEPTRRATGFITTDPTIYAVVPVTRIVQGTVVSAAWTYNGVAVPALDATVTADHTYEDGWIAFELARPDGAIWPTGEYGITIAVNGEATVSSSISVQVPPA